MRLEGEHLHISHGDFAGALLGFAKQNDQQGIFCSLGMFIIILSLKLSQIIQKPLCDAHFKTRFLLKRITELVTCKLYSF